MSRTHLRRPSYATLLLGLVLSTQVAAAATIDFVEASGASVTTVPEDGTVYLRVADALASGSMSATVTSSLAGDSESVQLVEVGAGLFEGSIDLLENGTPTVDDGVLATANTLAPLTRDTLTASYQSASANAAVVGSITRFLDAAGRPASVFAVGSTATVEVTDHRTPGPFSIEVYEQLYGPGSGELVQLEETGPGSGVYRGTTFTRFWELFTLVAEHQDYEGASSSIGYLDPVDHLVEFTDADGVPVADYVQGAWVGVRVTAHHANVSDLSLDLIQVELSALLSGDSETFDLVETTTVSGVFESRIAMSLDAATPFDNLIQVTEDLGPPHIFDTLTATYGIGPTPSSAVAATLGSRTRFLDAAGNDAALFAPGSTVYVQVERHAANLSGARDTVTMEVHVVSYETETLTLSEVGYDSGLFEGSIELEDAPTGFGDGRLQASPASDLLARYEDLPNDVWSEASARVSTDRIVFIDDDGRPAADVRVGTAARLRVVDFYSAGAGNLNVEVTSRFGNDSETLSLSETDSFSGVFEGSMTLSIDAVSLGDGVLQVHDDPLTAEEVTATYGLVHATVPAFHLRLEFLDADGEEVDAYALGETLRLRLTGQPLDFDSFNVDTHQVDVFSGYDQEVAQVVETGPSTGIFEATLPSREGFPIPDDGELSAEPGERVEAKWVDGAYRTVVSKTVELERFLLELVDGDGEPTDVYAIGGQVHVRLTGPLNDYDPGGLDVVYAYVEGLLSGDVEMLTLNETGPSTGVFEGSLPSRSGFAQTSDGTLDLFEDPGPPVQLDLIVAKVYDAGATVVATAGLASSFTTFIDAGGNPADAYVVGHPLYVRVVDHGENYSPGLIDLTSVDVTNLTNGDTVLMNLTETGPDTGVFEGSEHILSGWPPSDPGLQASSGDTLQAMHTVYTGSSSDEATVVDALLFFIDEDGEPTDTVLEGGLARLRLLIDSDPLTAETFSVNLTSLYGGDSQLVTVDETGEATSVFEGSIRLGSAFTSGFITSTSGWPDYLPDQLTASFGSATAQATATGAEIFFLDAWGRETTTYVVGETVFIRIIDHNANYPGQVDTFSESLEVVGGDTETVDFTETGDETGVFEAQVVLGPSASSYDGFLDATGGDVLRIAHLHYDTINQSVATAGVVSSQILFLDAQGQPATSFIEGSTLYVRVRDASMAGTYLITINVASAIALDTEWIDLIETGPSTGVFEGSIELLTAQPSNPGNFVLETWELGPPAVFDTLTAIYVDLIGPIYATATTSGSRIDFVDADGNSVVLYAENDTVYVRLEDPNQTFETTATLTSLGTFDEEQLTLYETAAGSGIFEGSIPIESGLGYNPYDGAFQADAGETIEVRHTDYLGYSEAVATATMAEATIAFIGEDGKATTEVLEGGLVRIRLFSSEANYDSGYADTAQAEVRSLYGMGWEYVYLTETGVDTNVFEGEVQLMTPYVYGLYTANSGAPEYYPEELTADHKAPSSNATAKAHLVGSRTVFLDASAEPTALYVLGDTVTVRVVDHLFGDPYLADSFDEMVTTSGGDEELVTLTETGLATGVFEGSIALAQGPSSTYDGTLHAVKGETITVRHGNVNDPGESTAVASVTNAAAWFIDAAGDPTPTVLEGSTAYIRVYDVDAALSAVTESMNVWVTSQITGDSENVLLLETGATTGVFEGSIELATSSVASANGVLETWEEAGPPARFDTLTVTYTDPDKLATATAFTAGSAIDFVDAAGQPVTVYVEGQTVYVRLEDHNLNTSLADALLTSLNTGDVEPLSLTETAFGSGVFEGSISHAATGSAYDGTLQATWGETLDVRHTDYLGYSESVALASIVAAAVTFIDEEGVPTTEVLEGSLARLRLESLAENVDPGLADTVQVELRSLYGGDSQYVSLFETGASTSVFEGTVQFASPFSIGFQTSNSGDPLYLPDELTAVHWGLGGEGAKVIGTTVSARADFLDLASQPATSYALGATVYLRIVDHNFNDPLAVDSIFEQVTSSGDTESVILTETGLNTGVFVGELPSSDGPTSSFDGVLSAVGGATVSVAHSHYNDPGTTTAQATFTGNLAPVAVDDSATAIPEQAVTIDVLANDSDADSASFSVTAVSPGASGSVVNNGTDVTYTSAAGFSGVDTFTYVVTDSDGGEASATVTVTANTDPVVAITAPADGSSSTETDPVSFAGTADDNEDGDIAANLNWTSSIDGAIGTGASFATSTLSVGIHTITAEVTDSHGANGTASITVTVNANVAPVVAITAPADGSSSTETDPVSFAGTANDSEDGDIGASLSWTSSIDGAIGTGASFATSTLSVGTHAITAEVTDSHGATDTASITVTVNANVAPVVAITAPADGSSSTETDPVSFAGTANDNEDGDIVADLTWTSSIDGAIGTGASFAMSTLSVGTHTITAEVTDSHGATGTASITVTVNANVAPAVAITAPANGSSSTETDPVSFAGTANDNEDGDIVANLTWTSSIDGAIGTGASFTTSTLSVGTHTVTASVTDSHGATGTASITVTVNANVAPAVAITAPANGSSSTETDPVSFAGTANDTEDGDIVANLNWTSSIDGAIGTGASFATSTLSVGTHTITASVTDSHGATGTATITVTVNANAAPAVTVTAPADGTVSTFTDPVTFAGSATDNEDGDLTAALTWTSSIDGAIGTGASFSTTSLSLGSHLVTAQVIDSHGATSTASITVTVNPNVAPVVTVTAPVDGDDFTLGDTVTFTGTALDNENGDLSAALAWTSDRDGAIGTGASFSTTSLSLGSHVITASVTDSHGATSTAQVTILIRPLPVQVILTSIGAEDGRVREQSQGSGTGGRVTAGNTGSSALRAGDDRKKKQYKAFVSFDTSSIPDGAEIQVVDLRLQRGKVSGTNPFTLLGSCRVDVSDGGFNGDPALESVDFEAPATATQSALMSDATSNGDWSEGTLDAAGRSAVNKVGKTQFRVYFDLATDGDGGNDYMGFYSGNNSDPSRHPQLVVTYQEY